MLFQFLRYWVKIDRQICFPENTFYNLTIHNNTALATNLLRVHKLLVYLYYVIITKF